MGGDLEHKLEAIRGAGFGSVELWASDLLKHPGGAHAAAQAVKDSGLKVGSFQMLRDFDSGPREARAQKIEVAKNLMQIMQSVDARLLRVSATTSPFSTDNIDQAAEDLATLATLAIPLGMKIGFEALPNAMWIRDYAQAWEVVQRANCPNLGVVVNAFHVFVRKSPLDALRQIPVEKIALVPLADFVMDFEHPAEVLQHQRVFPGEGSQRFGELLKLLEGQGYRGDYAFEVLNDGYGNAKPSFVAERGRTSVDWLNAQTTA
ncbi:hypothetical protein AYR66_21185 [Noviherbaspirillum denitrificans]|uniref:Xylose isomerase-like TIM barrel domain-containing protein n=2 Tax=Noviherbaspirillum denitrificans TaxID=1968433 RepID=A0A254THH6_9BURK|nr:hypothetical protein AYR66_21185 [Noviherbaspirillum denitrificans]